MAAADTKDVKATERITYESNFQTITGTAGNCISEHMEVKIELLRQEIEEKEREEKGKALEEESPRVYELSEEDYQALICLVEAEAGTEGLKGKMLVANVVLNRVNHHSFPDTVAEVVYQKKDGKAQFSPVSSGKIHEVMVSEETIEAVERVLCGEDESQGALYFVARAYANPKSMQWFDNHLTWLFEYKGHEFFA